MLEPSPDTFFAEQIDPVLGNVQLSQSTHDTSFYIELEPTDRTSLSEKASFVYSVISVSSEGQAEALIHEGDASNTRG